MRLFDRREFIHRRFVVFFACFQGRGRVGRAVGGIRIALRFQAKRTMVYVLFLALESARFTSRVKLYAGEGGVAVHSSARLFVVHVREML